jgi:hypothetical protein
LTVTEETLRITLIGQTVNTIKKKYTSQQTINDLARVLVTRWKKVYDESKATTASKPQVKAASVSKPPSPDTKKSRSPEPASAKLTEQKEEKIEKGPKPVNNLLSNLPEARKNV